MDEKKKAWEKIEKDQIVTGIVRRLTDFGAFVDIGGVDGLIHVTDLAWHRVKHPSEVVTPGQEVTVKIIGVDKEKERIQLSLKALQPQPWDVAEEKYPEGSIVEGKVVRITTFGAFVELSRASTVWFTSPSARSSVSPRLRTRCRSVRPCA